jgi:hypothetical protein
MYEDALVFGVKYSVISNRLHWFSDNDWELSMHDTIFNGHLYEPLNSTCPTLVIRSRYV